MTTTVVSTDVEIAAPPDRVFDALTNPRELGAWWGGDASYRTRAWSLDARVGGAWSARTTDAQGREGRIGGTVVAIDAPSTLAYTWRASWDETDDESIVQFELAPCDVNGRSGTRLTVTHSVAATALSTARADVAHGLAGVIVCLARTCRSAAYGPGWMSSTAHRARVRA